MKTKSGKGKTLRKKLRKELWKAPDLIGIATHWTWILCVFWSPLYYDEGKLILPDLASASPLEPLWFTSLLANVITIAFLLMLSHFRNPLSRIKALPYSGAILTALGTVLVTQNPAMPFDQMITIVYLTGAILTGIGSAIVVVLWGELLASLGAKRTIDYLVLAFIFAALAFLILVALPRVINQMIIPILPVISMVSLVHFRQPALPGCRVKHDVLVKEHPPYKLIAISSFFGFSFGVMKGLFVPIAGDLTWLRNILNIIAIVGASAAIFLTISVYKMDFDHMTYQVALPLMAAGFLFMPLHDPWNIVGTGIHQFGYQYFYIILWAIWPVIVSRAHVPSGWITAWGLFSIQFGQLTGSVTSGYLANLFTSSFDFALLAAGVIFLILLIALFTFGNSSPNTGWGFIKPAEETDTHFDFEQSCLDASRRYHLSPRETEVFFLLARGRNRAHISEELVVSEETVKSHVKSIYRKTNVHSQQLLIDMIEAKSVAKL